MNSLHVYGLLPEGVRPAAAQAFGLPEGHLMKVLEEPGHQLPTFAVFFRAPGARRGRRVGALVCHSLARANGWDQPVSARGAHDPKTPASGEGACRVAAAGGNAGVDSAFLTLRRPREAIV